VPLHSPPRFTCKVSRATVTPCDTSVPCATVTPCDASVPCATVTLYRAPVPCPHAHAGAGRRTAQRPGPRDCPLPEALQAPGGACTNLHKACTDLHKALQAPGSAYTMADGETECVQTAHAHVHVLLYLTEPQKAPMRFRFRPDCSTLLVLGQTLGPMHAPCH